MSFLSRILASTPLVFVVLLPALPAGTATFECIGPDGGTLTAVAPTPSNPDRLYCLVDGKGIFRSDDGADHWTLVNPTLAWGRPLAVSPFDPKLLLTTDEEADVVRRSTDGGFSFTSAALPAGSAATQDIAFDPGAATRVLLARAPGGVYRSTDAGLSWTASGIGLPTQYVRDLEFHPDAPGVVLAATSGGFARSTDGGQTWTPVGAGISPALEVSYCTSMPSRVWALGGSPTVVLRSDDGGLTFDIAATEPWAGHLSAHPVDPSQVIVAYNASIVPGYWVEAIRRSTDDGATWTDTVLPPGVTNWDEFQWVTELRFDTIDPSRAYATIRTVGRRSYDAVDGLLRSTDGAATWAPAMAGIRAVNILAIDRGADGTAYARRSAPGGVWRTAMPGGPWLRVGDAAGMNPPKCFGAHRQIGGLIVQGGYHPALDVEAPSFATSTDRGDTWTSLYVESADLLSEVSVLAMSRDGSRVYVWVGAWSSSSWWLRYGDPTGTDLWTGYPTFQAAAAVVDPVNRDRLLAIDAVNGAVRASTDTGQTWQSFTGPPTDEGVGLFMDPDSADRLVAVYRNSGAWRSDDGGGTWSQVVDLGGSVVLAADWDPTLDRFALATQDDGVYVTGLGFVTSGLPSGAVTCVLFERFSNRVLVGTSSSSVWAVDAPDPTDAPTAALVSPRELTLDAQPNPFRSSVELRLSIPGDVGSVTLAIFDVRGRRISTLHSGAATWAGTRVFRWDGRDLHTERAAAGVYFARAVAGDHVRTRRIVLLDHS